MPETGALIGTPASISARVEPQTEPIDDEPFDSSVSETMRIVYGNSSAAGSSPRARAARAHRGRCRGASGRACGRSPRPSRAGSCSGACSGRSVSSERSSIRWPSFAVPSVSSDMICVWPRVKRPEPCVRGLTPTSTSIGRISSVPRPSGPTLVDRDLLADEALVDRLGGLLDVALRERVLDAGASPSAVAGPTGNGSSTVSMIRSKSRLPLRRLELLRVLLGVGERTQVVLELLAHRRPRRRRAAASRGAASRLARTCSSLRDVVLGRVHRERGRELR